MLEVPRKFGQHPMQYWILGSQSLVSQKCLENPRKLSDRDIEFRKFGHLPMRMSHVSVKWHRLLWDRPMKKLTFREKCHKLLQRSEQEKRRVTRHHGACNKLRDRQTDRQTDRQIDRTDRTDRTDRQTNPGKKKTKPSPETLPAFLGQESRP